ncbi:calcium sensor protein, putative [Candida dubliniensis CD36]|uniref:Calcium-binding protein NCS-1 n=1 Tax=Candida dubliniensis (strain CD36 / ATCC MYA-646 / CBS 7987 / NCPF 3949 / NRRL Y-17841) TaxID=573826 RepID=B9W8P5_CANDC|nr:calcium sensor protein, putative [Candida dubliniensis CD36]CAX45118.1 calcium sensor protein, putative [Candida dubliniensis CD36]
MGKTVSKLSKDDLRQLRQATYFDKRELQQWYKGFLRDCPSGQLSEEEFVKVYKQFFPFGDPTDYCHYLFRVFDLDNSKYIDFKEFIIALSITSRGTEEQKINWSFKMYDYKKEGKIGYKEILPIVKATYKMVGPMVELPDDQQTPEARVDRYFQLLGKDKNTDKLDLNDFKKLAQLDSGIAAALNSYSGLV